MKKIINSRNANGAFLKFDLKMKLTIFFALVTLFQLKANSSYSQLTKVSIDMDNVTINDVIRKIESLSEYKFLYNRSHVNLDKIVSVKANKKRISKILTNLFENTDITFEEVNKQIVLKQKKKEVVLTTGKDSMQSAITGTVSDENGEPLPGANILEKGTTNGTQTDFDGNFAINVTDTNAVLVISYIGFTTKEVSVSDQTSLTITMVQDAGSLDEVVVVGYGTTKKVNLTGAISTVNFDETIENRPITNASQALGGTVSGVWVSQNSGSPGSDGAQLRVRGWGTLNNSNPLIIIDGIEGVFSQVNPNDIESITVLKDAASAAIYGSKAANGVVLVTTKTGKKNEKTQVEISSYAGLQTLGRRYEIIDNSVEYMELYNQALVNDGSSPLYPDELIQDFRNGTDKFLYPNTNFYDHLFKTATIHEHNLSIRGGSENISSYISFNFLDQDGIAQNTDSNRFGIRANLESSLNDWLTIGGRISYTKRESHEPYNLNRVWEMLEEQAPFIAPFDRLGRFGSVQAIDSGGNLLFDNRHPLIDAANGARDTENDALSINAYANIKFTDYLSLNTTFSVNDSWNLVDRFNQSVFGYTDSGLETITRNFNREGLEISRAQTINKNRDFFSTLNFNKTFNDIHEFKAIAGVQFQNQGFQMISARRADPPKEGLTQVDAGTSGDIAGGNFTEVKTLSYFGRLNYVLSNKYLFEANIRSDASSRFAEGNRTGIFPGFSVGWRIIEEDFMKNSNTFSNLKLRASWGELGNQNIGFAYPAITTVAQSNTLSANFGGNFSPGAAITTLVDESISWETSSTLDIGLEVGLLDNKLNIEAGYFRKETSDIIVRLPIPSILGGLNAPFENVGEMLNTGAEFNINFRNKRKEFGYDIGLNLTYVDNEVTKFRGGNSPDQRYLIREGFSFQTLYGLKMEGIYQTDQEALDHLPNNGFQPVAGNIRYADINGDGQINFEDNEDLGNTIPKFTYGASAKFNYKGFDLNFLFQGIAGVNAFTRNPFTQPYNISGGTVTERWRNAWTPENGSNTLPSIKLNNSWDLQDSSFWVSELSYLKLKNIQLGYSLPDDVASQLGIGQIYIYANAQNVFAIVDGEYEGYDPERSTFNSGNRQYPTPRIVSLGVNVKL